MSWVTEQSGGVILNLRIVPRASKNEVAGEMGDALKIRLQAPPVEGKANKALIDFLSKALDVSRSAVTLVSGETDRNKRVVVAGISETAARQALGPKA
jgi:uncharacterized protein (TIGR00251 family)